MSCSSNGYEKHLAFEFVLCTSKKVPVSNFLKPDSDTNYNEKPIGPDWMKKQ